MKIGYNVSRYATQRNIIGIVNNIKYKRVISPYIIFTKVIRRIFKINILDPFIFTGITVPNVDIIHFFNTVSFNNKTPWITTFETILPRFQNTLACHHGKEPSFESLMYDEDVIRALKHMSSNSCKNIIAMSECNSNMQKELLKFFPHFYEKIVHKLIVLHPPQKNFINNFKEKKLSIEGQINFLFVGSSFHRKGGMEIIEVFRELNSLNTSNKIKYDFKLTIVSSLSLDNYATKENKEDIEIARDLINKNNDFIEYYERLPNEKVIQLMKKSHVGLLPTYADTYGYSVLEFQACGCPVITSSIRALPEINNNEIGWMFEVPKNNLGEGIYTTNEERIEMKKEIINGLKKSIIDIFNNRNTIVIKANKSIQKIKKNHSPKEYANKMNNIYNSALQN